MSLRGLFRLFNHADDDAGLHATRPVWTSARNTLLEAVHLDCPPVFLTALTVQPAGRAELLFTATHLILFARWTNTSTLYMDGHPVQVSTSGDVCSPMVIRDLDAQALHNITVTNNAIWSEPNAHAVTIFGAMAESLYPVRFGARLASLDSAGPLDRRELTDSYNSHADARTSVLARRDGAAGAVAGGLLGGGLFLMLVALVVYIVVRSRRDNPPERVMHFDYEHARVRSELELRRVYQARDQATAAPQTR